MNWQSHILYFLFIYKKLDVKWYSFLFKILTKKNNEEKKKGVTNRLNPYNIYYFRKKLKT